MCKMTRGNLKKGGACYLNVPIRPSRRNEGYGIVRPQSQTTICQETLVFSEGRLNLDDFSGRLIFIQTVEKQINVTGARYFPIDVLLPDEPEYSGNGELGIGCVLEICLQRILNSRIE